MSNESTLIVGAGPIGLSCAISAKRRGVDPLVIDAGAVCHAIYRYPVGMTFFTTPERLEIGGHPLVCAGQKATREETLKYYRGVARTENLRVRTYVKLTGATRQGDSVLCDLQTPSGAEQLTCDRLVLSTGYFDRVNRFNVPGEDLPHVSHYFDEAHSGYGQDVVVIGGKNSAVEAALELFRAGARVTLVYRGKEFPPGVKYWLRPDIENRIKAGEIKAYLGASVIGFTPSQVRIRTAEGQETDIDTDKVYALIGFQPDFDLFERIGIDLEGETRRPKLNPETLETNVPGVYMIGSITRGSKISDIFIENGRFDGEKVFGDTESRARAENLYKNINRYYGE